MTYGSEPRRRHWPSESPRWPGESRHTSEDDDAENWLAGFRPDPADQQRDVFGGADPAFGRSQERAFPASARALPASDRGFPSPEEAPKRPGRRRRADPDDDWDPASAFGPAPTKGPAPGYDAAPASVDPTRPAWPETWQEWRPEPTARPGRHSAPLHSAGDDQPVQSEDRPVRGRRRAPEPDDPPPAFPTRTTARASIPVGNPVSDPPRPPAPPPVRSSAPAPPSRRRATATARVAPPVTAQPPTTDPIRRGATTDTGTLRRGATADSGAIRRMPRESAGRGGAAGAARALPTWLSRVLVVVTALVLVLVGLGGYMLINGRRSSPTAKQPANGAHFKARDISSRVADPVALTEAEVFPDKQVAVHSTVYPVLKTEAGDCAAAATDDLAKLLTDLGCSQVVRGTLRSADSQYLITAGIFNLADEASADKAYETIKPTLDAQKGRFTGLAAGDGTEAIVRAPTTLGWHPLGHFLAYCIVARVDGKPITADDPDSKQVISDVVEGYLRDHVLAARAGAPVSSPK